MIDAHPQIAAELAEAIRRRREGNLALKERLWGEDVSIEVRLDAEEKERLRALGYVD